MFAIVYFNSNRLILVCVESEKFRIVQRVWPENSRLARQTRCFSMFAPFENRFSSCAPDVHIQCTRLNESECLRSNEKENTENRRSCAWQRNETCSTAGSLKQKLHFDVTHSFVPVNNIRDTNKYSLYFQFCLIDDKLCTVYTPLNYVLPFVVAILEEFLICLSFGFRSSKCSILCLST